MSKYVNIHIYGNAQQYTVSIPNKFYRWLFFKLFNIEVTTSEMPESCMHKIIRFRKD